MTTNIFYYDAIRFRQSINSDWLVSFAASALEIDKWGGIPEKRNFDAVESTGFQRTFKQDRLKSLVSFFSDEKNILQNPLLCAPRNLDRGSSFVSFIVDAFVDENSFVQKGKIEVHCEDFSDLSLRQILSKFKEYLEERVPDLRNQVLDVAVVDKMKERLNLTDVVSISTETSEIDETEEDFYSSEGDVAQINSSHISELWQDVNARISILDELGDGYSKDEILGFSKDSIISYLKPVIIVDGQHRLKGAIEHANTYLENDKVIAEFDHLASESDDFSIVESAILKKYSRYIPISLIMSSDPAEHVFQFVVVNQKATPINNSLLGTIVSTTLSPIELERVALRLKNADIPLDASHAVSFATRHTESPFNGLVQTGISGEQSGKLPWSVMKSIVSIFKDLKGAKFYSDVDKVDYADLWRRRYLDQSLICGSSGDCYLDWSNDNGLWKGVFVEFWKGVRDKFGNVNAPGSHNYWGNTSSNLFNKVSLTILTVDFFKFLCDTRTKIESTEQIKDFLEEWLDGVDDQYFNRDWYLSNVKKDSPGIRKQWNKLWLNYRQDPRKLPAQSQYKINFS